MLKIVKRIFFLLSLIVLYFIVKEFLVLYSIANDIHPYAGYGIILISILFLVYFVFIPIVLILKIPKYSGPTQNLSEVPHFIEKRLNEFRENPFLIKSGFDFQSITPNQEGYDKVIKELKKESGQIRQRYISQLFYLTTIMQNGFLDALAIFSLTVNLVKEIFILYNGRVSNRDLITIGKKIYVSMMVGGSEGVEYATEELMSKFASDSLKGVPFLDKILGSLADGFVNTIFLTRIALIAENYCSMVYVKSDKDLFPTFKLIVEATKHITSDIISRLFDVLKKLALEKTVNYGKMAINPAAYVLKEAINLASSTAKYVIGNSDNILYFKRGFLSWLTNPLTYLGKKFNQIFK